MRKSIIAALLNLSAIGGTIVGAISQLAIVLPGSGRTLLASATDAVPAGNKVTVSNPALSNPASSGVPLEYTA